MFFFNSRTFQGLISGTLSQMSRSDIAHLHMRFVKIERVGQSARILSIHVKEIIPFIHIYSRPILTINIIRLYNNVTKRY